VEQQGSQRNKTGFVGKKALPIAMDYVVPEQHCGENIAWTSADPPLG